MKSEYRVNKGGTIFKENVLDDVSKETIQKYYTDQINSKNLHKNLPQNMISPLSDISKSV